MKHPSTAACNANQPRHSKNQSLHGLSEKAERGSGGHTSDAVWMLGEKSGLGCVLFCAQQFIGWWHVSNISNY